MKLFQIFLVSTVIEGRQKQSGSPPDRGVNTSDRLYEVVGSAHKPANDAERDIPPQFYLPGSLTPADVTKWGSGCSKHCLNGFGGQCKLCGSTACRVAPHEFECRQYKHCTLQVPHICKKGEDCEAMQIRWWQTCWTSPCTSRCWYKGSVGNDKECDECCKLACRNDDKFVGNSCFRCTLCKSRWGPHTWGKLSPEVKYHGHVCWGRDKTKGVIMDELRYDLPGNAQEVISQIVVGNSNGKPSINSRPDSSDGGISQTVIGAFDTTNKKPSKIELDKTKNCQQICLKAKHATVKMLDAIVQAKAWNDCKQCYCWENPDMEMCEAIDCHITCKSAHMSGESCLACTRCKSCPGVSHQKDTMTNAVESIFSRDEGKFAPVNEAGETLIMGERRQKRTVNSQFGYTHKVTGETTKNIKRLKVFNVFNPKCKFCVRMGQQQSCRESCAAYKRNPQNHIASHNCKVGKCAAKLAGGCKKCIRICNNIKSVALSEADKETPDLGKTTFETCYHTFGCANDCSASLKKVKGALAAKRGEDLIAVGDLSLDEQIQWAYDFPFESLKEARERGYFAKGVMNLENVDIAKSSYDRPMSTTEWKKKGWWWKP